MAGRKRILNKQEAIEGSSNEDHIIENYDIFDFELSDEEMEQMTALDQNNSEVVKDVKTNGIENTNETQQNTSNEINDESMPTLLYMGYA